MGMTSKAYLQNQIEELKLEVERWKQNDHIARTENEMLKRDKESLKDTTRQQDKRIDGLHVAVDEANKEVAKHKEQAAEYKRGLDGLKDTKTVLDNLMSILRSPHNDYQKIVDELSDMLQHERTRANALENELRNIQFDIQHNKFLEGKVQAYEAMFRVNPVRAEWDLTDKYKMPIE